MRRDSADCVVHLFQSTSRLRDLYLISGSEPCLRRPTIEDLMTEISRFEAEYAGAPGCYLQLKHAQLS
jgi:hypothetical protein